MTPRSRFFVAIALAVIAIASLLIFATVRTAENRRRGAAGLTYIQDSGQKVPAMLKSYGFAPGNILMVFPHGGAERAGLRAGDRIISIAGVSVRDQPGLVRLDRRVKTGDTVIYRIVRNERERDVPVVFNWPMGSPLNLAYIVIHVAVALAFLVTGVVIFVLKRDDRRVFIFYVLMIVGAVSITAGLLLAIDTRSVRGIDVSPNVSAVSFGVMGGLALTFMPLALHLALIFPKERKVLRVHPSAIRWVYAPPIAATVTLVVFVVMSHIAVDMRGRDRFSGTLEWLFYALAVVGMLVALRLARTARTEGWPPALWRRAAQTILAVAGAFAGITVITSALKLKIATVVATAIFVSLPFVVVLPGFAVLACIALYRSYRESGVEERRQVKWPLWGTLIALGSKIFFLVLSVLLGMYAGVTRQGFASSIVISRVTDAIPVLLYLLIPLSFAAAILKYRLMNIDVIIRKTVVYAILSGMIVIAYLVLVGGLGTLLVNAAGLENQTVVIASTLIVALFFVPVRNKLQSLVDRNLFRQKYDYPAALAAISASSRTAEDQGEFLTAASEKIQQALQNRAVVVFLERHGEFVATAKVGVADSILGNLRVAASVAPSLDRPFDPRRRTLPDDVAAPLRKVETELVVPIESRGLIALAPKLSGAQYDVEDIDFLHSAADSIAAGINRIRMQVDEEDVSEARTIQQSLLPRFMPRVAGIEVSGIWQPARTVGGDYYDLLELSDTKLAICIGDVAGKGMPAALLMSGLQAAVRASASATNSPREVCERVRRVVVSSLTGGRFVTFFYAVIDMKAMQIRWCNAGHNPPILVHADGSVIRLEAGGPVLSRISRDAGFEEGATSTASGDRIVLFTDGVSEARDSESNDFGEERLAELVVANRALGAHDLQNVIVNTALGFSRGELEDDVTLVVAAITQPA